MIGETISHYKILEKIGEGGMGVVYKAQDTKLDRFVALKFLASELTRDATAKQRFIQEAKAASKLDHPNICTIYEINETEDGQLYIAMAYYEGETLKEKTDEGPLRIDETLTIAMNVAEGLKEAHEHGITHRDIKPSNIMITDKGQTKILDFGLAKSAAGSIVTKAGTTLGTIAIMSPEQARGEVVDKRTDIWSLGVVIYNMLTGQMPFKGEYEHAIVYSIMNVDQEPITGVRTGVPIELEKIINKCLEKDKSDRYPTAEGLMVDLRRLKKDKIKIIETPSPEIKSEKTLRDEDTAKTKEPRGKTTTIVITPKKKKFLIGIASACLISIIFLIWFFSSEVFKKTPEIAAVKEKSIAVMYFENRSGEPDLEKILVDMLTTNLSRYEEIEVVSSQRLFDILKLIGKQDVEIIDKSVATEVATRAQVKSMLLGSINKIGSKLSINAQLCDVQTGNIIGSAQVEGTKVEDIFDMVDSLTEKVGAALGVSVSEAGSQLLKITDVTTNSFEAYKYYQKGLENIWRWNFSNAAENFQRSIDIDPTFAMAHLQLALVKSAINISNPLLDLSSVRESLKLAKKYSAKATDKEQRFIDAFAPYFNRDFETAYPLFSDFVKRYPNEKDGALFLSYVSWFLGKYDQSIQAAERALEIDPTYANAYNSLAYLYSINNEHQKAISTIKKYMSLQPDVHNPYDSAWEIYMRAGQLDEAYSICEEALKQNAGWYRFHIYEGYIHLFRGEGDEGREKIQQAAILDPGWEIRKTREIGYSYLFDGRYREAFSEFEKVVELTRNTENVLQEIRAHFDLGKILAAQNKYSEALKEFSEAGTISSQLYDQSFNPVLIMAEYLAGTAMLQKGDYVEVQHRVTTMKALIEQYQFESFFMDFYHMLLAELHLAQSNGRTAMDAIGKVSSLTSGGSPRYRTNLAAICELQGDAEKAISMYKNFYNDVLLRNYFSGGDYFDYFLGRSRVNYSLAKIYEQQGDKSQAIEYYEKALNQWKNADTDLPELIDVKKRLANLKGEK